LSSSRRLFLKRAMSEVMGDLEIAPVMQGSEHMA
jgi:hypothetical protein